MGRNVKRYSYETVAHYLENCNTITGIDVIDGCLLDTFVAYHDCGVIEVFEEAYLNEWSSAYARHIYRAGLPHRFTAALEAQYALA